MGKSLDQILASLPAKRRAAVEARAAALIEEERTLRDLRKALGRTQAQLAKKLGVGQDAISRLEQRSDILLSTLQDYVRALGGELSLVATFPDRPAVSLKTLQSIADARPAKKKAPARPRVRAASARKRTAAR